jgi:4'-phosphopantetheinyl transferase EntD
MASSPFNQTETQQLAWLIPKDCYWFVADQVPTGFSLYNEELKLTSKMVKKRLDDFKASRFCARQVLDRLNIDNFPILIDANRAPIWPTQVIGSISHAEGRCIAVATRSKLTQSIGIDVESNCPLKAELIDQIMTPFEVNQVDNIDDLNSYAKLIFSIKESVYKCIHPLFKKWVGFKDVSVELDRQNSSFRIKPECGLESSVNVSELNGRWVYSGDWVYTCCWLKRKA